MNYIFRLLDATNEKNITNVADETREENSKCEMFGGFGFLIQAILGAAAFSILIVKRYIEKPRRAWKIWFYDVAKQIISSLVLHLFNLIISAILSSDEKDADACVWYFVTVVLDCTLGAFLSYIFMWLIDGIANSSDWTFLKTGLYYEEYLQGNKKNYRLIWKKYLSQLGVWLGITLIVKIILLIMLKICKLFLVNLGTFFLSPFSNAKVRLVMVMIIFPVILNALYFWVVDNILKLKESDKPEGNLKEEKEENRENNVNIELNQLKNRSSNNSSSSSNVNNNEVRLDAD
jgi:hypothetical protein